MTNDSNIVNFDDEIDALIDLAGKYKHERNDCINSDIYKLDLKADTRKFINEYKKEVELLLDNLVTKLEKAFSADQDKFGNNALYNKLNDLDIIEIDDPEYIDLHLFFDHTINFLHKLRCADKDERSSSFHEELLIYSTLSAFLQSKMQGNLSRAICSLRQEVLKKII